MISSHYIFIFSALMINPTEEIENKQLTESIGEVKILLFLIQTMHLLQYI